MSGNDHHQYYFHGNHAGMSAPSPYPHRNTNSEAQTSTAAPLEDCRDYLRTGRCKYGASCKYNHPPNVQSGGGMRTPIDPSEPLYPIRPNEPVCNYFIKHGTCKFGQACKFHHPPQMAGTGGMANGNSAVLVTVPVGRKQDGSQGFWTTGGNDSGVQILPQRPDEPNCIYFLKNGRCKYGATCRYHHPLNIHDRSGRVVYEENGRPRYAASQDHRAGGPKVHYVTSLPPGSLQQGHFVVADGNVTFLALDGAAPTHLVSIPQSASNGKEGQLLYTTTAGTVTSSSSSTSIASSFETAVSTLDGQDSTSSLWNRKTPSSNPGNGYSHLHQTDAFAHGRNNVQGNRMVFVQSIGEGGAASLPRVVSAGSASDGSTVFFDANGHSQTVWRGGRSSSFDQTRSRSASLPTQDDEMQRSTSVHSALDSTGNSRLPSASSPMMNPKGHRATRNQRQPGEVDDGLSQMTSALLTMLDTPEEVAAHQAGYDIDDEHDEDEQQALTPRMGTRYSSRPDNGRKMSPTENTGEYSSHPQPIHYSQHQSLPPSYMDSRRQEREEQPTSWLPSWQDSNFSGDMHDASQSVDSTQQSRSSHSTHHNSSHVGLYLP